MHRKWIVDEATRQRLQRDGPSAKLLTPVDMDESPQEYTTVAREMAALGAERLSVLKVRTLALQRFRAARTSLMHGFHVCGVMTAFYALVQ